MSDQTEMVHVLPELIAASFSLGELADLCNRLGDASYEKIAGNTIAEKSLELVGYFQRRGRLDELLQRILHERPNLIGKLAGGPIPFVVTAMNNEEASKLKSLEVFSERPLIDGRPVPMGGDEMGRFQAFLDELYTLGLTPDMSQYRAMRDQWHPHGSQPIGGVIAHIAEMLHFEAVSFSEIIFDTTSTQQRQEIAVSLQRTGCILIIDTFSVFHPGIIHLLRDSGLMSAGNSIATLLLSPLDPVGSTLQKTMEGQIRSPLYTIYQRFEELDMLCEVGMFGPENLRRWLFSILPQAAETMQRKRADPGRLAALGRKVGTEATGIHRFITGRR